MNPFGPYDSLSRFGLTPHALFRKCCDSKEKLNIVDYLTDKKSIREPSCHLINMVFHTKQVNGMFPQGLKSAFGVNQLCLAKKGLTVTSQNEMSVDGKGVVGVGTDATRTILTTSSGKSHTFRPELFDALKQVEEFSKAGRPFFVKQLTRAVDDFERIALAHHLHDLRILDAVEIQRKRV